MVTQPTEMWSNIANWNGDTTNLHTKWMWIASFAILILYVFGTRWHEPSIALGPCMPRVGERRRTSARAAFDFWSFQTAGSCGSKDEKQMENRRTIWFTSQWWFISEFLNDVLLELQFQVGWLKNLQFQTCQSPKPVVSLDLLAFITSSRSGRS